MSTLRSERAVAAAVAVASRHGIPARQPRVLWDSNNTLVHLHPAPVVAKAAANERQAGTAGRLSRELAVAAHLAALGAPVAEPSHWLPRRSMESCGPNHAISTPGWGANSN